MLDALLPECCNGPGIRLVGARLAGAAIAFEIATGWIRRHLAGGMIHHLGERLHILGADSACQNIRDRSRRSLAWSHATAIATPRRPEENRCIASTERLPGFEI